MEKRFERSVSYTLYKNEFHHLFIAFLKDETREMTAVCRYKYNFYREVVSESKTRLTVVMREKNVPLIQEAMFKSASWLAGEIWEN